jgi:hypothetical protein
VCDNSVTTYGKLGFGTLKASKMGHICDKEVLFFGEDSRDTSYSEYLLLTVHIHDLIGLKNWRFDEVKNNRKGKNGLIKLLCFVEISRSCLIYVETQWAIG